LYKKLIMPTLRKYVTTTDMNVYEVEVTEEQLEVFKNDEDRFYDEIMEDLDWEWPMIKLEMKIGQLK